MVLELRGRFRVGHGPASSYLPTSPASRRTSESGIKTRRPRRATFTSRASINRHRVRAEMPRKSAAWATFQGFPGNRPAETTKSCLGFTVLLPDRCPSPPTGSHQRSDSSRACTDRKADWFVGCEIRFLCADLPGIEEICDVLTTNRILGIDPLRVRFDSDRRGRDCRSRSPAVSRFVFLRARRVPDTSDVSGPGLKVLLQRLHVCGKIGLIGHQPFVDRPVWLSVGPFGVLIACIRELAPSERFGFREPRRVTTDFGFGTAFWHWSRVGYEVN